MTESDLISAAHDALSRMDAVFDFWMSGTFATLIAFYFIGNRVPIRLKTLGAFLYVTFSTLMITRLLSVGAIYTAFREELIEMGSVGVIPNGAYWANSVLNVIIYLSGIAITLFFIFRRDIVIGEVRAGDT